MSDRDKDETETEPVERSGDLPAIPSDVFRALIEGKGEVPKTPPPVTKSSTDEPEEGSQAPSE